MLKFLTHKLRTHSLNEESVSEKVEERDSGTESDDDAAPPGDFCTDVIMKWNDVTDISMGGEACACAPAPPRLLPDPEPDHLYDHHSSEEELEVINGLPRGAEGASAAGGAGAGGAGAAESRRRGASSPPPAAPEKRKWPAQPYRDLRDLAPRPASSDDDDTKVETPVRFRTSPPLEALKPRRGVCSCGVTGAGTLAGAAGPAGGPVGPAARGRAPLSPRRRRLPLPPPRRHRPALDFDKMQQLKVGGGVRSWRAVGGAHGGELSVFCW
ncbi:uncharacterized protein LOC110379816 isoform X3 [Helicoverpa armigera]|uniref:uncharacterized protein LOC110379816 isoform X3 n=1 Tax=Helicoverpa armigera TaxID=29058 RepID=UPI0030826EFA